MCKEELKPTDPCCEEPTCGCETSVDPNEPAPIFDGDPDDPNQLDPVCPFCKGKGCNECESPTGGL